MSDINVMVVDDAKDNRLLLQVILEDHYQVIEAESGKDCLEQVDSMTPNVILLDVNMPGMTGHEVCTQLRKQTATSTTPIIFVSGLDTVEERLAGFEVGGDEYITKPVDPDLLLEKIRHQLERNLETQQAKNNATEAMSVAMEAMTSSSELGQIINFVKDSQEIMTLEEVGQKVCEVVNEFGLNACTMVESDHPIFSGCQPGSIEAKVLERSRRSQERVINVGIRTIVKSNQIAMLVKNMPIEDEARYGRFKDHLAVLISITDGRLLTIQSQLNLSNQRKDLLNFLIKETEDQLKRFGIKMAEHDYNVRKVMLDMIRSMESRLFTLGLEEDQEVALIELAYAATKELEKTKGSTKILETELGAILEGLYEMLNTET